MGVSSLPLGTRPVVTPRNSLRVQDLWAASLTTHQNPRFSLVKLAQMAPTMSVLRKKSGQTHPLKISVPEKVLVLTGHLIYNIFRSENFPKVKIKLPSLLLFLFSSSFFSLSVYFCLFIEIKSA